MRPGPRLLFSLLTAFAACGGDGPEPVLTTSEVTSPSGPDSGEPFLSASANGVHMSWLEGAGAGHNLYFAHYANGAWSEPVLVQWSDRFFVNWADFPSIRASSGGTLWAHWLERGDAGGYDYGVRIVRSGDDGATWSDPLTPHSDDTRTEHGFVSSVPVGEGSGEVGYLWLDGRATPDGEPMALYFRTMGAAGPGESETLVDGSVCDCCQTDAVLTSTGPLVVYRDRTPDEIRDIYVRRFIDGAWTEGRPVHVDGWETGACPVNGPAAVADGEAVAVAWFTAAGGIPKVQVAFSSDAGARFGEPTLVDDGNPAGRVDLVMLEDGSVLVSWLERTADDRAEVRVRRVRRSGQAGTHLTVSGSSSERASGFPRIANAGSNRILVAWTDVSSIAPRVRTAIVEVMP